MTIEPTKVKWRYCDICGTQLVVEYPASRNCPECPKCGNQEYW